MKHLFVIIFLFVHFFGRAQSGIFLGVNDSFNSTIDYVQNYFQSNIVIPVAHKKLTVLHLISTTCAPCLAKIPTLDSYQRQFDEKIQIILVFREDLNNINKYKQFVTELQNTKLPIITKESGLYNKFKISVFGDNVWIDDQGIIKMQNRIEDINPTTISDFLKSKKTVKSQIYHEMDNSISVFENLKKFPNNKLVTYFQLFRLDNDFQTDLRAGLRFESSEDGSMSRVYSYDIDLRGIAKRLFEKHRLLHQSRVIFDIQNKEQFIPNFDSTHYNHFAFEYNDQKVSRNEMIKLLKMQIENSLKIQFIDTIFNIDCYILKRYNIIDFKAKHIIDETKISAVQHKFNNELKSISEDFILSLNSYRWGQLVEYLNMSGNGKRRFDLFIVDETGIDPNLKIDMNFLVTPDNIDKVNNSLKKYGLVIEKTKRLLPVILIKDRI